MATGILAPLVGSFRRQRHTNNGYKRTHAHRDGLFCLESSKSKKCTSVIPALVVSIFNELVDGRFLTIRLRRATRPWGRPNLARDVAS